ncbi:cytochrome b [Aestuariibacter sp. GS-14]|uniref:cytochrome b n=1 Tax=Aestuariibacter sp. GS-14 TaxID=2590670 RepID=UPI00112E16AB|nr:cytochrome b [Aestuariibacter sp. GS-14]TPV54335.1 cytochrome b [Aestuariibacter sp. GS-14]
MTTPKNWPFWLIAVHWLTALVVAGMFGVGIWMVDLTYYSEWYRTAPHWHKSVGILLAAVTLARLFMRSRTQRPARHGNKLEQWLSSVGHLAIYILLLVIFVSGYLISTADGRSIEVFNWFSVPGAGELFTDQSDIAGEVHEYAAFGLIGLVVIHALAAFKHHFISRDATLSQMTGRHR